MCADSARASSQEQRPPPPTLKKDWRFYAGLTALLLALVTPLFALAVPLLGLPAGVTAAISGALVAGGPEILFLVAGALLGKDNLRYFTQAATRRIRAAALVKPVSRARYYVGLTIAVLSIVPLYLFGYLPDVMPSGDARLYCLAGADLSFILAIFIMGGEFWDKLRKLFMWAGEA